MTKRMSFASAPSGGGQKIETSYDDDLSFPEVAERLKDRMPELCRYLLPGGQMRGNEYMCGDLHGGRGRSLSVTVNGPEAGRFKDFANGGVQGADGINLWAAVRGCGQGEAKREVETWLGIGKGERARTTVPFRSRDAGLAARAPLANPETAAGEDDDPTWYRSAKPERKWEYLDARGDVWGVVYRFVHPRTGQKTVRPWDPHRNIWEAPEGKRPLYGLGRIVDSDQPVVLVEGEKCADAIGEVGAVGTTIWGGALAIGKTDWSPLAGRHVILWRDNDSAGLDWQEKATEVLRAVNVASVRVVEIPAGKPQKWDCADAPVEERRALLKTANDGRPVVTGRPLLRLSDWTTDRYTGPVTDQKWLVREVFPLGVYCLLAAQGDTGKGMTLLDMALKVAGAEPGADVHKVLPPRAFGGTISTHGSVVILSAEDDYGEIHRRMSRLDTRGELRRKAGKRLIVVPLPNTGGSLPLIHATRAGPAATVEFDRLRDQLLATDDLVLTVIDPLSSFILGDLNTDAATVSMVSNLMSSLASETGATILAAHHMRKSSGGSRDGKERTPTTEQVREAIRGGSGLVDGSRVSYALWPVAKDDAITVLKNMGQPFEGGAWRNRVVYGSIVKSNAPSPRVLCTYVRNMETGLLEDYTSRLAQTRRDTTSTYREDMVMSIRLAAAYGFPFTKTGGTGLFSRRERLAPSLRALGRDKIERLAQELLDGGQLTRASDGGKDAKWMDVVDGPFALGTGAFDSGACKPWEWWGEPEPKEV